MAELHSDILPDWTDRELREACSRAYLERGWPVRKIAEKLGLSTHMVYEALWDADIPMRRKRATRYDEGEEAVLRRCYRCKELKFLDSDFYKNARASQGRSYTCKSCERELRRLRRGK